MRGSRELAAFTEAMRERLNDPKNSRKGTWKHEHARSLFGMLMFEAGELAAEVGKQERDPVRVREEAADIAVLAMMVADVTGGLECGQ